MNGKERVARAMRVHTGGPPPDRTPVMCQLALGHMYLHSGMDPVRFWHTSEGLASSLAAASRRYGFDGVLVSKPGRPKPPAVTRRTPREDGVEILYEDGGHFIYPPDEYPRSLLPARQARTLTIDRVDSVPAPRPRPPYHSDVLTAVLADAGSELSVHGEVGTGFERFLSLFGGYEAGLMALIDDPKKSLELLAAVNEHIIADARWQLALPIDALKLSSPFAGGGLISRGMYRRFVLPFERELAELCRASGVPCYLHTCGAVGDRLDLMLETGADGIECLDPPPLGNVGFDSAVEALRGRAFIKGNLDAVNELTRSEPAVFEICRDRIRRAAPMRGGYILSSACSVSPRVPEENLRAMVRAALTFSHYDESR